MNISRCGVRSGVQRDSSDSGVLRRCAESIKSALVEPRRVCERLGLIGNDRRHKLHRNFVLVCCPVHDEHTPSCSVHTRGDGIGVKCHGCQWSGDVLSLVAAVHGLDVRRDFRDVLCEAANLAGHHQLIETIRGRGDYVPRVPPRRAVPLEVAEYPKHDEVERLWSEAIPLDLDDECSRHFGGRNLDVRQLHDLVRCMVDPLPQWARYRGASWLEQGFRAVAQAFDAAGEAQSVRAWRVTDGDAPKRLPPAGHRASGLVLANPCAVLMLRERTVPARALLIAEGEPDWATLCLRYPGHPVIGIWSGSWTAELAERIPYGADVAVRTHTDPAGEAYAAGIIKALSGRAHARRMQ